MAIQGDYDEAILIYSKVMPVSEAHANVAELAQARGDVDRAEADRAIATRRNP